MVKLLLRVTRAVKPAVLMLTGRSIFVISRFLNARNVLPNRHTVTMMSAAICCICRNWNGSRLLKHFIETLETGTLFGKVWNINC